MGLFSKFDDMRAALDALAAGGRNPFDVRFEKILSATEAMLEGRSCLLFGTNNYLGLTFDAACIAASVSAVTEGGTGTTGSRIANGTYSDHALLEQRVAEFYGKRGAMVFTTGYQANLGLISTLAGRDDHLLIDADSHASIYDACKLSAAEVIRFRHNDPADLARRLERLKDRPGNCIIVTEGIFSMLGDSAPLKEIAAVKRATGATLIVDEAHSLGTRGRRGRGVCEEAGVESDVDFVVGTFSKSLGAIGGFAVSDLPGLDLLRIACRPYMFTASLPPAVVGSVTAALARLSADPSLGARVRSNSIRLYRALTQAGFEVGPEPNAIVALKMTDKETAVRFWNRLLDHGVYANLALPPATPGSLSLIRCSVSAAHTDAQIDRALAAMVAVGRELGLLGAEPPRDVRPPALASVPAPARAAIEILPVSDKATLRRFIHVPSAVSKDDALWIPPLTMEREEAFSPKDNEFLRRAEVRFWIARRNGRDVGRISAQIDPLGQHGDTERLGHFGCLSAEDDPEIFAALLATAEDFLRSRGVTRVNGPFSLSINEETGLLVDGFDTPPMLLMGHDPRYTGARLEALGYRKEKDLFAYLLDMQAPLSAWARRMLARPLPASIKIRRLNFKDYANDIRKMVSIFNDAWSGHWGFVPLTEAETEEMAKRMRMLLDDRLVWFAEMDGEAVAFIVTLPNINEAIRDLDGRLLPFGWAKLLWRLKTHRVRTARVPLMGVRRSLAGTLIGSALPLQLIGAILPANEVFGFRSIELSWILEDNLPMRRVLERLGARAYKTYRIYGKKLAATGDALAARTLDTNDAIKLAPQVSA